MKRSDTLFRHKSHLVYDTAASIKEMVIAITEKTNSNTIDFRTFAEMEICDRVNTWILYNDGEYGVLGRFVCVRRDFGSESVHFVVQEDDNSELCLFQREEEMYSYTLDELISLHAEIEKIYKFVIH